MKANKALFIILLIALALRLAYGYYASSLPLQMDEKIYDALAKSLVAGRGFSFTEPAFFTVMPNTPTSFWEPIYPLFVALIYYLVGPIAVGVKITQAFVWLLIVYIVYLLGKEILGEREGAIAAGLTAVNPYFIYLSGSLLTENIYILLLTLSFLFLIRSIRQANKLNYVLSGACFGLSALTRETIIYFIPVCLVWLYFCVPERKAVLNRIAIFICTLVLVVMPWSIRNYIVHGRFHLISTKGGFNLYVANSADYRFKDWEIITPEVSARTELDKNAALYKLGFKSIMANPTRFVRNGIIKLGGFWSLIPNNPDNRSRP
ncbi:MAG: glycosyltransferase family 39 protein, partial [Candidatus Omnitrophica bacterium]|nr:glycosyltransferase family 39 protein [Candidatus Omnitrophota bacterium]